MLCKSLSKNKKIFLVLAILTFFLLNISSVFAVTYATVQDVYGILGDGTERTGAYNITFKVRSCDDSVCSGESWSSLYTNSTYNDISSLNNNQYFQYRAFFYTEDQNYTPMLFNSTVGYTKNIYPTNVTLNVGNDSDTEWNQTGTFDYSVAIDDTNTTPTFTSELNDVLTNQCTCSGCELNTTDRTCKIPFVLSSATQGKINVSNINISYDLMSLNITCIDQNSNTIETALVEIFTPTGNSTAWKTAYTDSSGKASFTTITGKTYDIKSSKTGYISNTENTNVGPNGTYTLSMTALIDYIKVYLYDNNNNPISGKTVNIYLANNATVYQTNTTDANGYTEFFVDVQNYDLRVDPTGWNRFYEDILNPYTKRLYGLLVNVTNQNAQAVNNAQVWVYEAGTTTSYNSNTNSSGMITFGLENQSYDISTFKQGVFSRLLRQDVPSTANIELDLTVTDYLDEINRTVHAINDTITNTIIPYLQEINSTTHTTYSYLTDTIKPQLDGMATNISYIRDNMATASALSSMQTDVTWLVNNVATQENITMLEGKIDTIDSNVDTLITRTDCSVPANSVLCTYLENTNSTVTDIKNNWGSYNATEIITRLNEVNTTTQNTYSYLQNEITNRLTELNTTTQNVYTDTQSLLTKWGTYTAQQLYNISNATYIRTGEIYNDMATASALSSMQTDVTWLVNNVATQENITLLSQKLDTINSTVNTIKTQTDCSNTSLNNASNPNYALCSYLYNINSTINTIYSEMATQENISAILLDTNWLVSNVATQENMTETFSRLTTINNTVNSISSDLLNINSSLQTKIDNVQNNVTWLIDNVATQENITEIIIRLTEINSTTNEIDDYLNNDITNRLTELNTTTQNNYDYLQNTVYTKLNETWNNTQQTLTYIGNPSDDENQNTLFGEHQYTQNRLSSIKGNLTEVKTLVTQINITTEAINSTISTILLEVDDLEELHQCSISPNSTICTLLNNIYTDTQNIYSSVQSLSSGSLFSISALIAGSPRYANENALIEATFTGQNGSYVTPDTINLTIWDPTYLNVWDTATKSDFAEKGSDHIWWYSKTISGNPTTGMYYVHMLASYNGVEASKSAQFRIATGGPYKVYLECPASSYVGQDLVCSVILLDEGEVPTESTSTVWVDTNNNGVWDAGETQMSFSKQTVPLQNVTQSVSVNVPNSHATGLYVVRVDTSYASSAQPNSGASDSVTFSTAPAGDTGTGDGAGGGGSITGKVTEIICEPPYIRHGAECCLDANNNSICDVDEGLPAEEEPEGEIEKPEEAGEEIQITKIFSDVFSYLKNKKSYVFIGAGVLAFILLLIFVLIKIFKHRGRSGKVKYLDAKLKHLKELKTRKEISKSSYATERGRLLSRINTILKGKHLVLILGAVGLITLFMLFPKPSITGGAIGVGESNLGTISWWAIFGVLVVLFLAGIFAVLIYILKELKKFTRGETSFVPAPQSYSDNNLNTIKQANKNMNTKCSTTSLKGLINKKVFTDSGHYIGEVKEVLLEENRIDSLKIKLDKHQGFNAKGIIIKYKHVKSVGHVVIVDKEILEKISSLKD